MDIYKKIEKQLFELGLTELNSRPYDCAYSVLEGNASNRKLIIVGFNGSNSDLEWTNLSALKHGKEMPLISNVQFGACGGWLAKTLPKRLLSLPKELGFEINATVYTNAILLCSKNAADIKKKAKSVGFTDVGALVVKSLAFFQNVTVAESLPELILAYSNSLTELSAASVIYEQFGVSEIFESNTDRYYKTFSFMAEIADQRIPVVCVRHMSRFKPCLKSIQIAWDFQIRQNQVLGNKTGS